MDRSHLNQMIDNILFDGLFTADIFVGFQAKVNAKSQVIYSFLRFCNILVS
jgi:hypothetical protein